MGAYISIYLSISQNNKIFEVPNKSISTGFHRKYFNGACNCRGTKMGPASDCHGLQLQFPFSAVPSNRSTSCEYSCNSTWLLRILLSFIIWQKNECKFRWFNGMIIKKKRCLLGKKKNYWNHHSIDFKNIKPFFLVSRKTWSYWKIRETRMAAKVTMSTGKAKPSWLSVQFLCAQAHEERMRHTVCLYEPTELPTKSRPTDMHKHSADRTVNWIPYSAILP